MAQVAVITESEQLKTLWLVVAGSLIFFMNAGFAMLETGLCQVRNSTNVLAKNLIVFCVSILAFWILGFGLMFGNGNGWLGNTGLFFQAFDPPLQNGFGGGFDSLQILYPNQPWMVVFFFQLVFAGTTATIVSGAMAERVKFWAFFSFSFCLVAIAYPITGRWVWHPNGWLTTNFNFLDFAGSTVVHSVGGMAGLVGTILIGPRRGWQGYNPDATKGHRFNDSPQNFGYNNLSFATLGCLILWLGWLGFNGGSARSIAHIPHIIATTMLAGASGGVFVLLLRGLRSHKPALSLVINGILGGLVSITASSVYVSLAAAIIIGAVSSIWIILLEKLLEQLKIDDPVGAIPVHLGCGIWGTLAAGLFANQLPPYINYPVIRIEQIFAQAIGIIAINLATIIFSLIFWLLIGLIIYLLESINNTFKSSTNRSYSLGDRELNQNHFYRYLHFARKALRVSKEEEREGSDGTFS
ncbi:ammonium permease [Waterburya agarophytonicola K14]|uniref:Ammonium permease n=1 Tax=Waterburya agarophytonicola KI4 TaxID=2874699 RepID=A0A964BNP1_9CYAN|nr:ammonium permease [Waterburya agarophytonicola]MCC0176047.1 ammonium permease [Waterburya agarophytonicola KI4]